MAYGTELKLEIPNQVMLNLATRLGVDTAPLEPDYVDDDDTRYDAICAIEAALQKTLESVHYALVLAHVDPHATQSGHYVEANTTYGLRSLVPFAFSCVFGDEDGGRWPRDYVAGITLWGRYRPVFVDYAFSHGGSGDPIRLTGDTLVLANAARDAIIQAVPEFKDSYFTVQFMFY